MCLFPLQKLGGGKGRGIGATRSSQISDYLTRHHGRIYIFLCIFGGLLLTMTLYVFFSSNNGVFRLPGVCLFPYFRVLVLSLLVPCVEIHAIQQFARVFVLLPLDINR
jgi:hypothetical protein